MGVLYPTLDVENDDDDDDASRDGEGDCSLRRCLYLVPPLHNHTQVPVRPAFSRYGCVVCAAARRYNMMQAGQMMSRRYGQVSSPVVVVVVPRVRVKK